MKHLTHTHNTSVSRCGTSYNRLRNNNSFELFKANIIQTFIFKIYDKKSSSN